MAFSARWPRWPRWPRWLAHLALCSTFLFVLLNVLLFVLLKRAPNKVLRWTPLKRTPTSQSAAAWRYAAEVRQLHAFLTHNLGYQFEILRLSQTGETQPPIVKYTSNNLLRIRKRYVHFNETASSSRGLAVYQYSVSLQSAPNTSHPTTAVLLVLEYNHSSLVGGREMRGTERGWKIRNQMSRGGSALRVDTSGPHTRGFCHVEDRFDGTYLATCPIHEANTTARIQRIRQLWTQFIPSKSIRRTVATVRALHPHESFHMGLASKSSDHEAYMQEAKVDGWWKEASGRWAWYENGRPLRELGAEQLKQCLANISNLIAIGDSHMRFNMFYVYSQLGLLDRNISNRFQNNYVQQNIAFYWSATARSLEMNINDLYKNMKLSRLQPSRWALKRDVLIINSGCHDLSSWGNPKGRISNYVEGMQRVFSSLAHLKRTKGDLLRMIWIGTPPTSHHIDIRNSEVTAAFNGWLYPRLVALGIEIVDVFKVLYPVSNEACDNSHYLCYDPETGTMNGEVGKQMVNIILHKICH